MRETEALIRKAQQPAASKPEPASKTCTRARPRIELRLALGTRVRIVRKGKGGRLEIEFTSEDELQRIFEYS